MFLFYVITFFKKGNTIQEGTLFKGGHMGGITYPKFLENITTLICQTGYIRLTNFTINVFLHKNGLNLKKSYFPKEIMSDEK